MADLAAELGAAAFRLRRAGDGLERELTAAIKNGADKAPAAIRAGLIPHLPDNYADELDPDLNTSVGARLAGTEPAVTVTARSGRSRKLRRLDAGLLAHPLWGDREHWYTQHVQPGWFTGPCEDTAPRVRAEIEKALHDVSEKAVKGNL